jgi:sarcosine oxidase subunit gamma
VSDVPLTGTLDLRLDPRHAGALTRVLGAALPAPNTWVEGSNAHILWQAFDEWLIVTPDGQQHALADAMRAALAGTHHAVTDVSDLRVALALEGPHARDVLQKGCAVDLHPRVFTPASCVTAALARVRVTLRQTSATPRYEILVERSYAGYLGEWLADAALG